MAEEIDCKVWRYGLLVRILSSLERELPWPCYLTY